MKVNCNGAFDNGKEGRRKNAGIRVVIRDENGRVVIGITKKVKVNSCIKAEAAALGDVGRIYGNSKGSFGN